MKIDFITVYTIDIEKSIDFYQRVLDFKVSRRFTPGTGMEIVFMDDQHGHQIEFIKDSKELPYSGSGLSLGFYVPDIKQTAEHLEKHQSGHPVWAPDACPAASNCSMPGTTTVWSSASSSSRPVDFG